MVKLVSLSDKAYDLLKSVKGKEKSFSNVIINLLERKGRNVNGVIKCAGLWNISKGDADKIIDKIYSERIKSKAREF